MYIPNIKASESLFSYLYRLASFNHCLTDTFFHRAILLKNGNYVGKKKASEALWDLIGESHRVLYGEVIKRAKSAPYNQRISNENIDERDTTFPPDKNDRAMRYCVDCICEQHYNYGHGWLKREWLFHSKCFIHNKRLLILTYTAQNLDIGLLEAFELILRGSFSLDCKGLFETPKFENRPCILAPCLLINFFKSTAKHGKLDFGELKVSLPKLISLFYQYLNCFPLDEKAQFTRYLQENAKCWPKDGMYIYKSLQSCRNCEFQECYLDIQTNEYCRDIDDADIRSILEWTFQRSELPEHVSERSLLTYSNVREYLIDFYEPNTFEADTITWLLILMHSTFGTHTEFVSRDNGGLTWRC